ncbi:hypothetical protein EDD86DRAFT_207110 [Gorgonomyces haynaldii]|nr:hypothetical protein EDD86DRAFT_207110 [Gorgonomyces haynaldii]
MYRQLQPTDVVSPRDTKADVVSRDTKTDDRISRETKTDGRIEFPFGVPGSIQDILFRDQYVVGYNRQTKNPSWTVMHLNHEQTDTDREKSKFREDQEIPRMFRSHLKDYQHSGYDRGHLVPAADIRSSQKALDETFLLSNMSPQHLEFNRGYWASVERFVRHLKGFDNVWVYSGPLWLPEEADSKSMITFQVIGSPPNTYVPTHFFKIIHAQKDQKDYLGCFVFPNIAIKQPLTDFIVPLESIEIASGVQFLPLLDRRKTKSLCQSVNCTL